MVRWMVGAGIAVAAAGTVSSSATAEDREVWRLFVSDHAGGVVSVVDPVEGRALQSITVKGPATLHRTESGETVFAVQGAAGTVQAISTGIAFDDHGDHGDIEVGDVGLLDFKLTGSKPAHFVERKGQVAMWFDGEESVRLFSERDVLRGRADVREAKVGAPHHGVGVPYGEYAVVSVPNSEDPGERPIGARVVRGEAEQIAQHECPGLHGSASSGNLYALACDTGLLVIEAKDGIPQVRHLAYPPSLPDGSSSTLVGGKGLQYFVGNYGPDRIVLVDPSEPDNFRLVELPTRRVHFVTDPIRSRLIYAITEDGKLHQIDFLAGKIVKSIALTRPYSMDGHWSDPRPRLAVAGDRIVVTDPLDAMLHLVNAGSFTKVGEIGLAGRPFNIVAVGGAGQTHVTE